MPIREYLKRLKRLDYFHPQEIKDICSQFLRLQTIEPNIINTTSPVTLVGDIHGQYYDLLNIFTKFNDCTTKKYIFLGDYVDRGKQSLHTYLTLCVYKILCPNNIFLVRGNHEVRNHRSGFRDEIVRTYKNTYVYDIVTETFRSLLVGVLVDARVLCVHGGISPTCVTISQMQKIDRFAEVVDPRLIDIMWSDPCTSNGFMVNLRGAGWYYGSDVVKRFLMLNNLRYIIRAHQMAKKGYAYHFEDKNVITVWSAPNYMYRCENLASVLEFTGGLVIKDEMFKIFTDVHEENGQLDKTITNKKVP